MTPTLELKEGELIKKQDEEITNLTLIAHATGDIIPREEALNEAATRTARTREDIEGALARGEKIEY